MFQTLLWSFLQVYRAEGTTQWYSAVTTAYNQESGEFTVVDDAVLQEHCEDPRLTQMKLLGEGGNLSFFHVFRN